MTRHLMPEPRIEEVQHFTSADGFFLRTLKAGSDRNLAEPRSMRLEPEYATQLGLADGSGTPLVAYGYADGQFRATAIRAFHIHIQPIEQMAVAIWKKHWMPETTEITETTATEKDTAA